MIEIIRYGSTPMGTFGELRVDGKFLFHTVEQEWNDNKSFQSCIPSGEYDMVPHPSRKYGQSLAFMNYDLDVGHWQGEAKRYACIIHTANYASDVEGCIGLGESLSGYNGKWMVTNSAVSVREFYEIVDPNDTHKVRIRWQHHD